MTDPVFDAYVEAWQKHSKVDDTPEGQSNLRALLGVMSDDVIYEDVPTGHSFSGHDGIAQLCAILAATYDVNVDVLGAHTDGERFAIEFSSTTFVKESGATIESRGVAVGTIAGGKVTSHRDYWVTPQAPEGA
jgi:ketosteroid isomerase-like protein